MPDLLKKLHEDLLEKEIDHENKVIEKEDEEIRRHEQEENGENALLKDLHNAEMDEEEKRESRESRRLDEHEEKLEEVETGKIPPEEAAKKAEEFKQLAEKADAEKVIDEDLFETPIQPLR